MLVQNMKSEPPEKPVTAIAEYIEVTAPMGSRAHITLADGSKIWLNAGTKLQYSNKFGKNDRNVRLTGEAYFSVAKRADLPFVIQAADIKITALGTAFNVKAYADEGRVETSLESGSVKIERIKEKDDGKEIDSQPIIVQANEKVSLLAYVSERPAIEESRKEEKTAKREETQRIEPVQPVLEKLEDVRVSTSWKDSNWVIRDESLKSLAVKLGRRYDVNFVFRDKELEKYIFSTTLRDETLEQVLYMLQFSAPISYEVREKNVYLSLNPKFKKTFDENIQ
jgi:ferric-dicitrate binding protein FerR (iron transport regulator)